MSTQFRKCQMHTFSLEFLWMEETEWLNVTEDKQKKNRARNGLWIPSNCITISSAFGQRGKQKKKTRAFTPYTAEILHTKNYGKPLNTEYIMQYIHF